MSGINTFNVVFQGVEYIVDVIKQGKDTTTYIEQVDSTEDIEESVLIKLMSYLISEGFVEIAE